MTKCILHMIIYVLVVFLDISCLMISIIDKDWWDVAFFSVFILFFLFCIRVNYKECKRIEESMRKDIQTVMNLQLFDLMRKAFTNHPDAFQNDFGAKTKDNDNEMATDK